MNNIFHLFERECDDSSHPMFCATCLTYQLNHKPDNIGQLHHTLHSSETYQQPQKRQSKLEEFFPSTTSSSTSSTCSSSSFPSSSFQSSFPSYGFSQKVYTMERCAKLRPFCPLSI
jgi:hypothetical protein